MSVSRPEAIASQPSACGRVAWANVSSNQRRTNGRKAAIQIRFYTSAQAHLAQEQAAQRAARILELRDDREMVVFPHGDDLTRQLSAVPGGGQRLALPVILDALEAAEGEQKRARPPGRAVHRAVAPRVLRRELEDGVEVAEADRLEIVEPADRAARLDHVGGQSA